MGNKYGAKKVRADGYTFDSQREYARYLELRLAARAGAIRDFEPKPKAYPLIVNGVKVVPRGYRPDFRYVDAATGELVVEDVKSPATAARRDYQIVKMLMLAIHGISILETY